MKQHDSASNREKLVKPVKGLLDRFHKLPRSTTAALGVLVFAAIGTALLVSSHAATPTADYEAEAGTRSGNAGIVSDSGASGASAVKFSTTAGSCAVATQYVPDGPDGMGGCFPGASNTGVPAGTTLTTYTGSCTITSPVTIDAKTLNCTSGLSIEAAGVVITRSKINGHIVIDTDVNRSWSLSLTDSEVDAGNVDLSVIANGNATVVRSDLRGGHNALECQEHGSYCAMRDSWVHGQYIAPGSEAHLGGVADYGRTVSCVGTDAGGVPSCLELVHNSIVCDAAVSSAGGGCTGDVNMLTQWGPLHGAILRYNLLGSNGGASYCTYGGYNSSNASDHIIYVGNVFQRGANNKCAAFGPVTNFHFSGTGNVWSNNKWDDGTALNCTAADECM